MASQRYDAFIQLLVHSCRCDVAEAIQSRLLQLPNMTSNKFQLVDRLKGWLDSFRPLSPMVVTELKKLYDVRFTRTGRLLMNLLLLRTGYPIVVIPNQVRKAYIDAVVEAQQQSDRSRLLTLILDANQNNRIDGLLTLLLEREATYL